MSRLILSKNFTFVLFIFMTVIVSAVAVTAAGCRRYDNAGEIDKINEIKNDGDGTGETIMPGEHTSGQPAPTEPAEYIPDEITDTTETNPPPATEPPVKKNPRVYQDKFDRIRAIYNGNEDIIGILKIPGTVIYYPVAYYADDMNDFYLNRNLYKQRSAAGSIFMDYENSVERYDPNTILYGHRMSVNSMFHSIGYYEDEDFFNNHRYIIFNTIYEDNVWEVFAFFKTHISFNYIKVYFRSERSFLSLAEEMKERSMHDTGIEINEGDRILTLSTCTNENQDTRCVLVAKMIKNKDDVPEEIAKQMASAVDDYK